MKKNIMILGAAMMLLSSCGIYNKYQRPEDIKVDGLYGENIVIEDTTSIASLSWRELFTDPYLVALIDSALTNNTDYLAAEQQIEEARAMLSAARLSYLPSLALAPNGSVSSFDGSPASWSYQAIANASWQLDLFGSKLNANRKAKISYEISKEYKQAVATSLVANVANIYYTLLMLDEQYRIVGETVDSWHEILRTMRAMKSAGMVNEASIAQMEGSCRATEAQLLSLKQSLVETQNAMCRILARTPGRIERGKLSDQTFSAKVSVGVPMQLLSLRPDVRMAEYSLATAVYATNAARSAFYPAVTLSGTMGWTNAAGSVVVNPGKILLNAAASLVQPIFQNGQLVAQLKVAKGKQEEAKLSFQQTLLNAGIEVNNALSAVQIARESTLVREQQVKSMETAFKGTKLLMQNSSTTYLEVLTAQQSYLSAQISLVGDKVEEIKKIIELYQALGGGRMD